jgi:hypothetical protein
MQGQLHDEQRDATVSDQLGHLGQLYSDQRLNTLGGRTRRFPSTIPHQPRMTMRRSEQNPEPSSSRLNGGGRNSGLTGDTIEFNVSGSQRSADLTLGALGESTFARQHLSMRDYVEEDEVSGMIATNTAGPTKYYAILHGREVGIFDNWEDARQQVEGVSNAVFKGFKSFDLASKWLQVGQAKKAKTQKGTTEIQEFNKRFRSMQIAPGSAQVSTAAGRPASEWSHNVTPIRHGRSVEETRFNSLESPISSTFDVSEGTQHYPSHSQEQYGRSAYTAYIAPDGARLPSQYSQGAQINTSDHPWSQKEETLTSGRRGNEYNPEVHPWLQAMLRGEGDGALPAYIPYVDTQYWGELKKYGLEFVVFPLGRQDLNDCIKHHVEYITGVAGHKMEAMVGTSESSMRHLVEIANLIQDVMKHAPEQEEEQAARLRGLADQLLRVAYNGEEPCQAVIDEIPTLHYLHAHMVTTSQLVALKTKLLQSAQHIDKIITSAFRKGFPSHVVQQGKSAELPMGKRAKELAEARADRVLRRAYTCVLESGTERQKIVDGTQSTTTGYSHQQTEDADDSSISSNSGSEGEATVVSLTSANTRRTHKSGKSSVRSKRSSKMRRATSRDKGKEFVGVMDPVKAEKLLMGCKRKSYLIMCSVVMENPGLEEYITQQVTTRLRAWMDTQRQGWTAEMREIIEAFAIDSWLFDSKYVSGGQRELGRFGYDGLSHTIPWPEMWVDIINIAQQHYWTVNNIAQQLLAGSTLEGQAKEALRVAKKSDQILSSSAPLVGDIMACLFRLGQIRVRMYLLVGKPIDGGVLNTWIALVLWDVASASSSYDKYTKLKELVLHKAGCTAQGFKEELIRQTALTQVGQIWCDQFLLALDSQESIYTTMGKNWVLTWDGIQAAADNIRQKGLVREQVGTTPTRGKGKESYVGALLVDNQVQERGAGNREGGGERYQTPARDQYDRGRSQSPQGGRYDRGSRDSRDGRYYRDRSSSPYRGGGANDYHGSGERRAHGGGDYEDSQRGGEWRGRGDGSPNMSSQILPPQGWYGRGGPSRYRGGAGNEPKDCVCGIAHFEVIGPDCPWRPIGKDGKPTIAEYNGWDIEYFCSKSRAAQVAMIYRLQEMPDTHPATMKKDMLKDFEIKVAKRAKA